MASLEETLRERVHVNIVALLRKLVLDARRIHVCSVCGADMLDDGDIGDAHTEDCELVAAIRAVRA
jgi:hypothetical protein